MKEAVDYLEHYRQFWEQSFDRLEIYLKELEEKQKQEKHNDRRKK